MRARSVWGRLGTLLQREEADSRGAAMFYRAVLQSILLYGLKTWFYSAAMYKKTEGSHTGFLRHITGKQAWRMVDRTCETPGAEIVWEAAGTQSAMTFIGRRQETMAQWVDLWPIFKVCTWEKGYKGGGHTREAWWRQEATEKQLWATLAGVSRESKRKMRQGERFTQ